ncbi:FkbM family methyltransferase [Tropicibacter oceani]|uniref:FkbM family methyltransferase n=1 Tax=Tropicibacter oceani TaxID=3058420 RepID=A0ABY8QIT1_9RHOB|nr:FkbM family methyltransferase [Tropicibacter oceani]WGW04550.1 FkbM family methyltransferase [Tropicibacter oceani]
MDFKHRTFVNEYGFYCVPDEYAKREIPKILAHGGVYEPNTLKLMRRRVGDGDIVTGGAFIGDFFPALGSALAPGARLISFEPNPLSFAAAQATIALNGLTNVDLAPVAVGEAPAKLHLQLARQGGSATAARAKIVENAGDGETIEVDVVPLDTLVDKGRKVSVLHLDVEGHEKAALLGAQRIIQDCRPMIVLEADRKWMRNMYLDFLNEHFGDLGYRYCGGMERNAFYLSER